MLRRGAAGVRDHLRHRAHAPSAGMAVSMAGLTTAAERDWAAQAVAALRREAGRSADTHLLHASFPGLPGIDFYFQDEAAQPTGSLKQRPARSLYLYPLRHGRRRTGHARVDTSSASTETSAARVQRPPGPGFHAE